MENLFKLQIRANKGKKIDDPFTRRSTKPRMSFKACEKEAQEAERQAEVIQPAPPPPTQIVIILLKEIYE